MSNRGFSSVAEYKQWASSRPSFADAHYACNRAATETRKITHVGSTGNVDSAKYSDGPFLTASECHNIPGASSDAADVVVQTYRAARNLESASHSSSALLKNKSASAKLSNKSVSEDTTRISESQLKRCRDNSQMTARTEQIAKSQEAQARRRAQLKAKKEVILEAELLHLEVVEYVNLKEHNRKLGLTALNEGIRSLAIGDGQMGLAGLVKECKVKEGTSAEEESRNWEKRLALKLRRNQLMLNPKARRF